MKLTSESQRVQKSGETLRVRFTATNTSDERRTVTLVFGDTKVGWNVAGRTLRRLGPPTGFVLPARLPISAFADGPGCELDVR
jgi:hypothetical protein